MEVGDRVGAWRVSYHKFCSAGLDKWKTPHIRFEWTTADSWLHSITLVGSRGLLTPLLQEQMLIALSYERYGVKYKIINLLPQF